ncbi:hypothetical protein SAMN05444000_113110 [Shimia gijangensis]|uniref:DUF6473 domain-containing protein n=2 Tax=Shimia gijangensis TaxID=1470563 RepID=A0A1M6MD71_9RHOB|nr:hypothetical protein SAMN05444000_113110 [Shimia gijangensis]
MSYEKMGTEALDYMPCRYGDSRLLFRGPMRNLDQKYAIFLGGTETYGKFIAKPFPDLVEKDINRVCVNFGCVNAGVDVFLSDPTVLLAAQRAETVVIQVMGAQNMSNRFYRVHPRRNDRFVGASDVMKTVFREIDFTEFHFTRHMLGTLCARAPDRYAMLRDELKQAWIARMRLLLSNVPGRKVLLWFAGAPPAEAALQTGLGPDPMFVDRAMIDALRPLVDDVVEAVASAEAQKQNCNGMHFNELERAAAKRLLGPKAHQEAADALVKVLSM